MDYLLKASVSIALFYICYKLFLAKETFFQSNRWFMFIGLLVSISLPFIVIPIYIEYTPVPIQNLQFETTSQTIASDNSLDTTQILLLAYSFGVILFFGKFCIEMLSLFKVLKSHKKQKKGRYYLIETDNNIAPFSFFNYIVYNPLQFNKQELHHIINHEKVHAQQQHSIDVIAIQICSIVFWYNPFVWLYKKEMLQNLEFIADQKAQNFSNCEKSYQLVLLKASVPSYNLAIANNFYNSLIKKRIVMLHKSKSNKLKAFKYALILPALALFLMSASTKEVYIEKVTKLATPDILANPASEPIFDLNYYKPDTNIKTNVQTAKVNSKRTNKTSVTTTQKSKYGEVLDFIITKDFTDANFDKLKNDLKKEGLSAKFKGIKRNNKNEITAIKIDIKSENSSTNYHTSDDNPISPIKITYNSESNKISIGNGKGLHKEHDYHYESDNDVHVVHTKGKGSNVMVFSDSNEDSDQNEEIIITTGENYKVKKGKKAYTIKTNSDKNEVIEVDTKNNASVFIIKKNGNSENSNKLMWTDDEGERTEIIASENENNTFIFTDDNQNPLFILNGKEISKKEMEAVTPDSIEKVEVLKGDKATKEYGDKGKDGVIIITTKKKN